MIAFTSCGVTNAPPPAGDLIIDCRMMPDPSPVVQDTPGTMGHVGAVILGSNPLVEPMLMLAAQLIKKMADERKDIHVVLVCNAGWHRSVFAAEYLAASPVFDGLPVQVFHRDLGVKA